MTIKTKLIANVLLTAAIIVAISLSSFLSLSFLQEKLTFLTEKSTPLQMRTLELQRELQGCITTLVKVNSARTSAEYISSRAEAETSLATVEKTYKSLEKIRNGMTDESDKLGAIAQELFAASEERINSNNAAIAANARVLQHIKESSAHSNDLATSIRNLQANYSKAFAAALENTGRISGKLSSIEDLRNLVRELQLITMTVQNTQNSTTVLIAKGKLKAVIGRIVRNEYYKSNKAIAVVSAGFTDKLAEYIRLQTAAIAQKDTDSKIKAVDSGKELAYKLNDLFQTLDQETMLARDELSLASKRQGDIFAQSIIADSILVANSELAALELMAKGETGRLFTIDSRAELDKIDAEIRDLFTKMNEQVRTLEQSLTRLNDRTELKLLHAVGASMATIRNEIFSVDGIVTTLKKKLNAIEQANRSSDKLRDIVIQQTTQGKESVSLARSEQETSITTVNSMVRRSLSQIVGIGFVAIAIGIFFGIRMYRSLLLPLRVVVEAVLNQQEQAKEKANLAEAVAGGDLDCEVIVGNPIELDPSQIENDEMGMVLNAIVGMSEAQVTLDRALVGMTESLRTSRDEGTRRDRLKSGLYELNKILRGELDTAVLADKALAFLAGFLDAGVGILYLYDENNEMLQTLSTYAISKSKRLNNGFRLGEGLAGQAALERKTICLDAVPPGYLPIASALGEADPLNIAILPIQHNDTLLGVMELGSFRKFTADDFEFLTQALEGVAIAVNVNRSRQLVDELLEQAQTEELFARREELQQSNEVLGERAKIPAKQRKDKTAKAVV
jgi:hypothetical protein